MILEIVRKKFKILRELELRFPHANTQLKAINNWFFTNSDPTFMESTIIGDETWVWHANKSPIIRTEGKTSRNQEKTKPKPLKNQGNAHCFFDIRGSVHQEFVSYLAALRHFRENIRRKRPESPHISLTYYILWGRLSRRQNRYLSMSIHA